MSEAAEEAKKEIAKQMVALVFMIIGVVIIMAVNDRDFVKTLRMRLAGASRKLLTSASHRLGHASMGIELQTGMQQYCLPYRLSLLRDKAQRMYDKAKEH